MHSKTDMNCAHLHMFMHLTPKSEKLRVFFFFLFPFSLLSDFSLNAMGSIDSSPEDSMWEGVAEKLKGKYKLIKQMQVCSPRSGKQRDN